MGDRLLSEGYTTEQITGQVEKIFNIIIPILKEFDWDEPAEGTALYYLIQENNALTTHMNNMKDNIREISTLEPGEAEYAKVLDELKADFKTLAKFEPHYLKTENVLFPYLEKKVGLCQTSDRDMGSQRRDQSDNQRAKRNAGRL